MKHIIDGNATTLVPGLILYSSWGYDQTNIDFYIVTKVQGMWAWVQEIVAPEKSTGIMHGSKYPTLPVITTGKVMRRKMRGAYISLTSYSGAFPWDGREKDCSHTH
jgi:hypothetical protein